jgi:glycosyltransferase involved in cell wall biosynthesis
MNNKCSISFLMVVSPSDEFSFFVESVESMVNQTLPPDEIVIIINGAVSINFISFINDLSARVKTVCLHLKYNYGLAYALNVGLEACNNDLVARMDPDDVSLTSRLEIQCKFMNSNPHLAASSAWIEEKDWLLERSIGVRKPSCVEIDLNNRYSKIRSPLNHIPSIYRKKIILAVGGYPDFKKGQDYALWGLLLVNGYILGNIPQVLAHVRAVSDGNDRRGVSRLKSEIPLLLFLYRIKFLSLYELLKSVLYRASLRVMPFFIRRIVYRRLRG